jgi:cation diffusion facilitator CzcD-associated flavoprotein CzcO
MLDLNEEELQDIIVSWLKNLEQAISEKNYNSLKLLFDTDSYWRDLLAFTWNVTTVSGADKISESLAAYSPYIKASKFKIDKKRTPPRIITRAGKKVIEAIIRFETAYGQASGIVRFIFEDRNIKAIQAWTLLTALEKINGFEETIDKARPSGKSYSREFNGPNWFEQRQTKIAFKNRDPAVLVVGGGQAGLSIAARLTQLNIDTLVIDREERIGDNWRKRYHSLTLHNQVHVNHLPYMPFPPNWPTYIPKDKLAGWFEAYSEIMELNFWTNTELVSANYNGTNKKWSAELKIASGNTKIIHPNHIIMATGVSGIPNLPNIPSLENFSGTILHSSKYKSGHNWVGKRAIVIGTGNSGHDIAQDLISHSAKVTLIQRSPTMIVSVEPSAQLPYALYDEGPNLNDCDLISASMPLPLTKITHQMITAKSREIDKTLLDKLDKVGFKLDFGTDDTGWQFKYLERGGGYYFNVGCSDLIASRKIKLLQLKSVDRFITEGVMKNNGEIVKADLVVLATGFKGQDYIIRKIFGDSVNDLIGPIWGFDSGEYELRNMWTRTAQPGLWFIAGSFAQCRIYSKYLGLQIKACEEGIIPLVRKTEN